MIRQVFISSGNWFKKPVQRWVHKVWATKVNINLLKHGKYKSVNLDLSVPKRVGALNVPWSSLFCILHKYVKLNPHKMQLKQEIKSQDGIGRFKYVNKIAEHFFKKWTHYFRMRLFFMSLGMWTNKTYPKLNCTNPCIHLKLLYG